jgi:hypothetical protein
MLIFPALGATEGAIFGRKAIDTHSLMEVRHMAKRKSSGGARRSSSTGTKNRRGRDAQGQFEGSDTSDSGW